MKGKTALLLCCMALTGCATMFGGGGSQLVTVMSQSTAATVTITATSGLPVTSGQTPLTVLLSRKGTTSGLMSKGLYTVEIAAEGFEAQNITIGSRINPWIFANVFNLSVGMAVDYMTGAMNKLDPATINVTLRAGDGQGENNQLGVTYGHVRILDKNGRVLREVVEPLIPVR